MAKEVDLSEFAPTTKKGPSCSTGLAISKLEGEKREKVLAALAAPEVQHRMIALRLTEWAGMKVSAESVGRHRRTPRICACD